VETGPTDLLVHGSRHPYTRALLAAVPRPDPAYEQNRAGVAVTGEIAGPVNPPPGCRFHPRCPLRVDACRAAEPPLQEVAPGHSVACFRAADTRPTHAPAGRR